MTRAYVLDPVTRATLGLVDQSWERLSYVRRYTAMDTFELVINRTRLWASELAVKRLLYLPDEGDLVFVCEQIASVAEGSTRNDEMTVTGRSLEGIAMAERLVEPPAGESHDRQTAVAAETAIKHYLRAHAADLAAPARQVPGLVVAADAARGPTVTVNGRFQTVLDLVREIGLLAGLGWEITYAASDGDFVFDVTYGVDRSASVFFDFAFETLERWEELTSVIDAKTVAVVAGQGEGTARDVAIRWLAAEPTGFERREAFLDARDVEAGETTVLAQRGDAFLAATGAETSLEADIHQYGGFRYREHWDVGDVVTVRNAERGLGYPARIVEVEKAFERSAAAPTVTATLGRPFPTLASRSERSSARTADAGGASITGLAAGGVLAGTYPNPAFALDMASQAELDAAAAALAAAIPTGGSAGPDADATVDAAGATGTAGTFARSGHGHRLNSYASVPERRATTGSAGSVATAPSRGNHVHPWTAPIRRVYTSSSTWSKPSNLSHVDVEVQGGGGSSGGTAATGTGAHAAAGGGGGGGYAKKLLTAADLAGLSTATVTVGAGGTAPSAGNNGGSSGGTSSFAGTGITTVAATGGGGGQGGPSTTGNNMANGGSGGVGSGGDVNADGGGGGVGVIVTSEVTAPAYGGGSALGAVTEPRPSGGVGYTGARFGGGASGSIQKSAGGSAYAGAAGYQGVVIVTEYYL